MTKTRRERGFTAIETVMVVGLIGVLGATATPMIGQAIANFRLSGDGRSVSNAVAVAKMRAASKFSRVRLYVDLAGGGHRIESFNRTTNQWVVEGGTTRLFQQVSFGFGAAATPPVSTQGTIGQAAACTDGAGATIANTACVIFNSRGVPIDSNGASTSIDAVYLTDGTAVYGVTVAATGMIRTWRTPAGSTPTWVRQ